MLHPVLKLALIGFPTQSKARLVQSLQSLAPLSGPTWQLARHEKADAWLVHPDVLDLSHDHARVWDSPDRLACVRVVYEQLARPVAIAMAAAAEGLIVELPDAAQRFQTIDGLDPTALQGVLMGFEQRMRLLRCRFTLGEILLTTRPEVTKEQRGYQLSFRQTLIATVDTRNMRVHVGTKAVPVALSEATWQPRPVTAAEPTASEFASFTIQECLWEFSQRSEVRWLPVRYQSRPVHFWRTPNLRCGFFQDEHLGLLAIIKSESQDFATLKAATGWSEMLLTKTLEGLWVTGAISTVPMKGKDAPGLLERLFAKRSSETESSLPLDSSTPPDLRNLDWARDTTPADLGDSHRHDDDQP